MKLVVVVVGDGRGDYLARTVASLSHVYHPVYARIMVNDEANPLYQASLDVEYPEWEIHHTGRQGMAGAVQAGFTAALAYEPDYVLWVEEDMLLIDDLPIGAAAQVLDRPQNQRIAQMVFKRLPWWGSPDEMELGDQWQAIKRLSHFYTPNDGYSTHDFIFSLNPCLIPRRILEMGWDKDNEAGMTRKLLDQGFVFGHWGGLDSPALVEHIGHDRSQGWAL